MEGKCGQSLGHFVDEISINLFFMELTLLLLGSIDEIELLGFVVVLFVGVVEDVAREEGDLLGKVGLH